MKRILTIGLMLASALALTNCTEEIVGPNAQQETASGTETTDQPQTGIPFQVYASLGADTKTVGSEVDGVLKTSWESGDKIYVFYAEVNNGTEGSLNGALFEVSDTENGLFTGFPPTEIVSTKTYNWYFLYLENTNGTYQDVNSIDLSAIPMTFNVSPKSIAEVAGANCPMYGKIKSLSGAVTPRIQMSHLTSLIELTIQNNTAAKNYHEHWGWTGGIITLDNVTLSSSTALTNSSLTANITRDEITYTNSGTAATALTSTTQVQIPNIGTTNQKYYFVVAPNTTATKHNLTFSVNGVSRTASKTITLNPGKVTRYTLPINDLTRPHISDAFDLVSTGQATVDTPILDLGPAETSPQTTATVNGQADVPIYILGDSGQESLTITGGLPDIINALDAGFYASVWPGQRSAMTLKNVDVYIEGAQIANYGPLLETAEEIVVPIVKTLLDKLDVLNLTEKWPTYKTHQQLAEQSWEEGIDILSLSLKLKPVFQSLLKDGIPRDGSLIYLTRFVNPQTITFNGVVENGSNSTKSEIIILNDDQTHKSINSDLIDNFIGGDNDETGRFEYDGVKPTCRGLRDILNQSESALDTKNNNEKTYAENTAYALYNVLKNTVKNVNLELTDGISISGEQVFEGIFEDQADFVGKLPDIELVIDISTCDYYQDKSSYGTKDSPVPLEDLAKNPNPIILWGLDVLGSNNSPSTSSSTTTE